MVLKPTNPIDLEFQGLARETDFKPSGLGSTFKRHTETEPFEYGHSSGTPGCRTTIQDTPASWSWPKLSPSSLLTWTVKRKEARHSGATRGNKAATPPSFVLSGRALRSACARNPWP